MKAALTAEISPQKHLEELAHAFVKRGNDGAYLKEILRFANEHQQFAFLEKFLRGISQKAKISDIYYLIADAQLNQHKTDQAAETLKIMMKSAGGRNPDMYVMAGKIFTRRENNAELAACSHFLQEGLSRFPEHPEIRHYRMLCLRLLGQEREALALYAHYQAMNPMHAEYDFKRGLLQMQLSDLTEGFSGYRRRFLVPSLAKDYPFLPWPEWDGEALMDKKIYVWSEQGVGDIIMWAGLLPWLEAQGAQITCATYPKLLAPLKRSFPAIDFVLQHPVLPDALMYADFDYHCPMGNLMPHILPHYTPAQHPPHLKADSTLVTQMRARYKQQKPDATRLIGLSWKTTAELHWIRNIPLGLFAPLLEDPHTLVVSLQYDEVQNDLKQFNMTHHCPILVDDSFDAVADFDHWIAQIAAMDEVYTIQNATAHIAGALGIQAHLFLSTYGSWHWGNASAPNLWYQSVQVHRLKAGQSWKSLIKQAAEERKNAAV